jgi:hypothetical protein
MAEPTEMIPTSTGHRSWRPTRAFVLWMAVVILSAPIAGGVVAAEQDRRRVEVGLRLWHVQRMKAEMRALEALESGDLKGASASLRGLLEDDVCRMRAAKVMPEVVKTRIPAWVACAPLNRKCRDDAAASRSPKPLDSSAPPRGSSSVDDGNGRESLDGGPGERRPSPRR